MHVADSYMGLRRVVSGCRDKRATKNSAGATTTGRRGSLYPYDLKMEFRWVCADCEHHVAVAQDAATRYHEVMVKTVGTARVIVSRLENATYDFHKVESEAPHSVGGEAVSDNTKADRGLFWPSWWAMYSNGGVLVASRTTQIKHSFLCSYAVVQILDDVYVLRFCRTSFTRYYTQCSHPPLGQSSNASLLQPPTQPPRPISAAVLPSTPV